MASIERTHPAGMKFTAHPAYRRDIDGLRAVAILIVVICHAFPAVLPGGYVGVDVFFVLSGYLITSILVRGLEIGSFSISEFYVRRVNRLFPALALMMLATLAAGYYYQIPVDLVALGWQAITGTAFTSNLYFWHSTNYFTGVGKGSPFLHLWSLGIEEQFYLLWPLLLWLSHKRAWKITAVLMATIVASFAYSVYAVRANPAAAFYSPLSRFWELGAGGILATTTMHRVGPQRHASTLRSTIVGIASLGLIVAASILFNPKTDFPGCWAVVPVAATLALLSSAPSSWVNRTILSSRPMVFIGLISYPLYLWHWPILVFLRTAIDGSTSVSIRNATVMAVLVAAVIAWLTYRYIEIPLRRVRSGYTKVAALLAAMTASALVGAIYIESNGFPDRIPENVRIYATVNLRDDAWTSTLRGGVCHNMVYTFRNLGNPLSCFPEGPHPRVMLWGDSHAAALFSGMNSLAAKGRISVWQITTDASAPFFDENQTNNMHRTLEWVNDQVLARIIKSPPDIIILHGYWSTYGLPPSRLASQIIASVDHIHIYLPNVKIVVLGPIPTWKRPLADTLIYFSARKHEPIPAFDMSYGLNAQPFAADKELATELPRHGIRYVSAIAQLCQKDGCRYRFGTYPKDLAYVDDSHLSTEGSIYLALKIIDQVLDTQSLAVK